MRRLGDNPKDLDAEWLQGVPARAGDCAPHTSGPALPSSPTFAPDLTCAACRHTVHGGAHARDQALEAADRSSHVRPTLSAELRTAPRTLTGNPSTSVRQALLQVFAGRHIAQTTALQSSGLREVRPDRPAARDPSAAAGSEPRSRGTAVNAHALTAIVCGPFVRQTMFCAGCGHLCSPSGYAPAIPSVALCTPAFPRPACSRAHAA